MTGKMNHTMVRSTSASQKNYEMTFISSMFRQLAPYLSVGVTSNLVFSQHATHGTRIMVDITVILLITGILMLLRASQNSGNYGSASATVR